MSEKLIDDPCDVIDATTLAGWTFCNDSSRMRTKNTREGLGGDSGDRHPNIRLCNDDG